MPSSPDAEHRPLVTSGTESWGREGAERDRDLLTAFLAEVAETETIQAALARSVAAMRIPLGARVLDLGCGTGAAFPALAAAVGPLGQITGLDHASGLLDTARERAGAAGYDARVALAVGDAHALPFADAAFDAAHTERVLIHLEDPDRALRELVRVTKPGGWVVCVEPDLAGMRVDGEDAAAAATVVAGFCASIRNPSMGLELNRRMAAAGLVDRRIETLMEVEREYDADTAEFFARAARTAVERGWFSERAAATVLAALQHAADGGAYTSYCSMFIVAGRVPTP